MLPHGGSWWVGRLEQNTRKRDERKSMMLPRGDEAEGQLDEHSGRSVGPLHVGCRTVSPTLSEGHTEGREIAGR